MNYSKMRFGFLSTVDAPLLPFYISTALSNGCDDLVVICDSKIYSQKDWAIWHQRTNDNFGENHMGIRNIYNLQKSDIPFYFVENHNNENSINLVNSLGVDCLVNVGTPRKLNRRLIGATSNGVINVHPGVLPKYRGCMCVEWAILNNDKIGNTIHLMDEGYDTGSIICIEEYVFSQTDDYVAIRTNVYKKGCQLLGRVLKDIQEKKIRLSDYPTQSLDQGAYWSPMPEKLMEEVIAITRNGKYRYQIA
jgi:methionyl-tRNA formyltransferase